MARLPSGFYKRGGIWWYRTDPITRRPASTGCKTIDGARSWLKHREQLANNPDDATEEEKTLGHWITETLRIKRGKCAEATVQIYQQKLGHFVRVLGAEHFIRDITPKVIDAYTETRRSEQVMDLTIAKELSCLNQVLKTAKRSNCYPWDIQSLRPLDLDATYRPQERVLTEQEVVRLLAALEPARGAYAAVCVGLGVRRGEAERLLPTDFDWRAREVFIGGTKTEGSRRTVPILSLYEPILRAAQPYLPLTPWGNCIRDLAAACRRAGIERCTRNDLRRTHSTLLHEAGVDRDTLRRLLGHSTPAMVDRTYSKPSPAALGMLAERQLQSVKPIQISYSDPGAGQKTANATLAQLVEQRFRKAGSGAGDYGGLRDSRYIEVAGEHADSYPAGGYAHDPLQPATRPGLARAALRMGVLTPTQATRGERP